MEAPSTSGLAVTNAARVGHTSMLRGNSAPSAFRMNIRQSPTSLAEIDGCSRVISWKRRTARFAFAGPPLEYLRHGCSATRGRTFQPRQSWLAHQGAGRALVRMSLIQGTTSPMLL